MARKPFSVVSTLEWLAELYWDDAQAFAEDILSMDPDEWQCNVFFDLSHNPRVSVRSGQGVGKTALEAACALWFMCTRPNCRVVATAPTRQQLNDVLWSEIKKWINRAPIVKRLLVHTATKVYMKGRKETWFATAKTATKPENMQGYHEDSMLFIIDEASGVADEIMEAVLGTLSGWDNKLLMCGNPNRTSGTFYDSHHRDRDKYKTHKVSSLDSPRTNKETISMLIRKYGENSNVVRVRVKGEFPEAEPDVFISLEMCMSATVNDIDPGERVFLGVDCGRFGDDEIVIYYAVGEKVLGFEFFHKLRTTELAGHIIRIGEKLCVEHRQTQVIANIDVGAMGGGVIDDVIENTAKSRYSWNVVEINFGGASPDPDCDDMATALYSNARELIRNHDVCIPDDDRTIAQMTTRKFNVTPKGKIKLEPKKEYKKRHKESPDRADGLVLCLWRRSLNVKAIQTVGEKARPTTAGIRKKTF